MRRKAYGYGAYRGRNRGSTWLKVLVVLLALALLLAVGLFVLAERYVVYDDSGRARLELPFLRREEPSPDSEPSPSDTPPVVTTKPEPEVPDRPEELLPVTLTWDALTDGTAAQAVTNAEGTAALFDMKLDDGTLGWVSEQPLAIAAKVTQADPERNAAILAGAEDGLYRVARVSCFKDHELSNADTSLALYTATGYRWLDSEKSRWLSPANETVQNYLTALCQELAQLGFDEILLDNAGYPTQGQLSYLKQDENYDTERLETVVTGFYETLTQALEGTGVRLSVVFDPEMTALSGQSEAVLRELGITPVTRNEDRSLTWGE